MIASDKHLMECNQEFWDYLVDKHYSSEFYGVDKFLNGQNSLDEIELKVIGEITGKNILHVQCHFGLATLSMAREGGVVSGADFSYKSIQAANNLCQLSGLEAKFYQSNVYELSEKISDKFDIVFTSYCVLCWLPDLYEWARQIASRMSPGGKFCLVEFHPIMHSLKRSSRGPVIIGEPYFNEGVMEFIPDGRGSYALPEVPSRHNTYEWAHPISEIITSLVNAGLHILEMEEYPYSTQGGFSECLEADQDGLWRYPDSEFGVPLTFSITAQKPK